MAQSRAVPRSTKGSYGPSGKKELNVAKTILNVATFGLLGALTKPFGKDKPKAPVPETGPGPRVMPLADDESVRRAKKASLTKQLARGGRSSTMLTGEPAGTTLGG
jgi:hypothetical protein